MATERRILTPIAASIVAGALVGVATLGGTAAGDREVAVKSDRFAVIGEELCEGQDWPKITPECLSWLEGTASPTHVRFVTYAETDHNAGVTTLIRAVENGTN